MSGGSVCVLTFDETLLHQVQELLGQNYHVLSCVRSNEVCDPREVLESRNLTILVDENVLDGRHHEIVAFLEGVHDVPLLYILHQQVSTRRIDHLINPCGLLFHPLSIAPLRLLIEVGASSTRRPQPDPQTSHDAMEDGATRTVGGASRSLRESGDGYQWFEADVVEREWTQIQTFGSFHAVLQGRELDLRGWRSKKAADVFAYLVLRHPNPVHQEELIELLWPDSDVTTGRNRLHHVVSELRKYLSPSAKSYQRETILRQDRRLYFLDLGKHPAIDHIDFVQKISEADHHWVRGNYHEARALYVDALNHKHGDFFPGYRYVPEFEERRVQLESIEENARRRLGDSAYLAVSF